jgi:hypothetical protein
MAVPTPVPIKKEAMNQTARNVISRSSQQTEKRPERARAHEETDDEDDAAAGHRRGQTAMSNAVAAIDPASPITPHDGSGTDCWSSTRITGTPSGDGEPNRVAAGTGVTNALGAMEIGDMPDCGGMSDGALPPGARRRHGAETGLGAA